MLTLWLDGTSEEFELQLVVLLRGLMKTGVQNVKGLILCRTIVRANFEDNTFAFNKYVMDNV